MAARVFATFGNQKPPISARFGPWRPPLVGEFGPWRPLLAASFGERRPPLDARFGSSEPPLGAAFGPWGPPLGAKFGRLPRSLAGFHDNEDGTVTPVYTDGRVGAPIPLAVLKDLAVESLSVLRHVALADGDGDGAPEGSLIRTEAGDLAVVVGGQQHVLYHTGNLPGGPPSVYVPSPHVLGEGDYELFAWPASSLPGTYPPATRIVRGPRQDPTLGAEPDTDYVGAYDLTSGTRVVGLGDQGLALLNTASQGNLGALVLGLDTVGARAIEVAWVVGTLTPGGRPYRMALQYRVGPTGPWALLDTYLASDEAGHSEARQAALPVSAEGQAYVQLRWKYHAAGDGAGTRPQMRVGNIHVTALR